MKIRWVILIVVGLLSSVDGAENSNARPFKNAADQRTWLENMVVHHRFNSAEISSVTGLTLGEAEKLASELKSVPHARRPNDPLKVLPYPGGRHPRIGFLEGAIDPQRETKLSIFTPWDDKSYVVADVPEAIWSNLGLTYLAHTHIDTIWSKQKIDLTKLEWERLDNGDYRSERTLPSGIRFGTLARGTPEAVLMKMWFFNGTRALLSDLRVQNCLMLKAADGFNAQTNTNKVMVGAFSACKSDAHNRWIITAWKPIHRTWANAPVPCLHSDPKFPDTKPGDTQEMYGLVSFFVGEDIQAEIKRLESKWDAWMKF